MKKYSTLLISFIFSVVLLSCASNKTSAAASVSNGPLDSITTINKNCSPYSDKYLEFSIITNEVQMSKYEDKNIFKVILDHGDINLDLTEKYVGSVSFKSWAFSYASMLRMVFRFTASFSGDYWYHVPGPRYVHTPGSYDFVYDRDSTGDLVWDSTNNRYNVESTGQACHYCSIEYLYGWTENTNTLTLYTQNLSRSEVILDSLRLVDTNLNVDTDYDTNKIVGNVLNSAGVAWENSNSGQFKIIPDDLSRIALNKSPCIFEDKDGNDILENLNNYTTFNFILVRNVGLQFMYSMGKYPIDYNVNLLLLKLDSDIYIVSGFHDESAYSSCGIDIASVFAPLSYITSYFTASSEYFPIDVIPGLLDCTGSGVLAYMNPSNNWNTYVNLDIVKFFGLLIDSANNTDLIFNIYTSPEDMNLNIKSNTIIDHSSDTIGDTIAAIYDNTNFTRNKLQDLKWNYSTGVYDLVFPTTPRESLYGWKETTTSDILYTKSATAVVGMPLYTESGEDANLVIDTVNANTITASIPLKSYNVTYDNTSYTAQAVENSGLQITASTKTEIDLGSDFTVTEI